MEQKFEKLSDLIKCIEGCPILTMQIKDKGENKDV